MHIDWFVPELLSDLGLTVGAVMLFTAGLILSYFVIKWAVRNGVREALHCDQKEQER